DLNGRANGVARRLVDQGVCPGDVVGIHLDRGVDLVAAVLGVLKAGAGYTVLDTAFPAERIATVVAEAEIRHVISEVDGVAENLGLEVDPGSVACVMFTSGSTGRPKGVVSSHRSMVGTFLGQSFVEFDDQVWLQCSPVSWDAFALELFGALLFGGRCVLQP